MRHARLVHGRPVPFIYAHPRRTYGDGAQGFRMPVSPALKALRPMNLYGWSKHLSDMAVAERARPQRETARPMGRPEIFQTLFAPTNITRER